MAKQYFDDSNFNNMMEYFFITYRKKKTIMIYKEKEYYFKYAHGKYLFTSLDNNIKEFDSYRVMLDSVLIDNRSIRELWNEKELEICFYYNYSKFEYRTTRYNLRKYQKKKYKNHFNKLNIYSIIDGKNYNDLQKAFFVAMVSKLVLYYSIFYMIIYSIGFMVYLDIKRFNTYETVRNYIIYCIFMIILNFIIFTLITFFKKICIHNFRPIKDNWLTLCVFGILNIWRVELWLGIVMSFLGIATGMLIYKWYYKYRTKKNDELREKIKNGEIKI